MRDLKRLKRPPQVSEALFEAQAFWCKECKRIAAKTCAYHELIPTAKVRDFAFVCVVAYCLDDFIKKTMFVFFSVQDWVVVFSHALLSIPSVGGRSTGHDGES